MLWILGGTFCQFSPGKIGFKFVAKNFTAFLTARKEICHLELTLEASSPNSLLVSDGNESLHKKWLRSNANGVNVLQVGGLFVHASPETC